MNTALNTALRRGAASLAGALLAVGLLTGCSPDLDESAAQTLQSRVGEVRTMAAQKNFRAALTSLDRLDADLKAAAASGDVSATREQSIREAVDLVRADLRTAIAAATPKPSPTATPVPPPVEEDADEERDEEGQGQADEKGKGKGGGPGEGKADKGDKDD